jgi:hypothetical protein
LAADLIYDHHAQLLTDFKYLTSITEDLIYELYRDAIISDHSLPFEGFTQEHRDAYLRLKTRGVRPADFNY